jgi:hypothetical protein
MIETSRLSIEIVRYLNGRTQGTSHQWTTLGEIADHIYGPQDLVFNQAVDLARCRGWIIVEGKSASRLACLTKPGCSLVLPLGPQNSTSCQPPAVSHERTGGQQEHGTAPAHRALIAAASAVVASRP